MIKLNNWSKNESELERKRDEVTGENEKKSVAIWNRLCHNWEFNWPKSCFCHNYIKPRDALNSQPKNAVEWKILLFGWFYLKFGAMFYSEYVCASGFFLSCKFIIQNAGHCCTERCSEHKIITKLKNLRSDANGYVWLYVRTGNIQWR